MSINVVGVASEQIWDSFSAKYYLYKTIQDEVDWLVDWLITSSAFSASKAK